MKYAYNTLRMASQAALGLCALVEKHGKKPMGSERFKFDKKRLVSDLFRGKNMVYSITKSIYKPQYVEYDQKIMETYPGISSIYTSMILLKRTYQEPPASR